MITNDQSTTPSLLGSQLSSSSYAPILTSSSSEELLSKFNENTIVTVVGKHSVEQVELVKKPCFILSDVLSKEECKLLIETSEKMGYEEADSFCHAYNDRYNDRLLSDDKQLTEIVWNRIKDFLPKKIEFKGRTMHLIDINSRWRLCKYKPGHYFNMHTDGSFSDHVQKTKSCLTLIIYLNSQLDGEYEGGSTIFYDSRMHLMKRKVIEPAGNALIFLQEDKDMLHSGEKVTKGIKYIMRTDVMYAKRED